MSFTTVVYASDEASYLMSRDGLKAIGIDTVVWCDARKYSRIDVINQNLNTWLLFLDHDCSLSAESFRLIQQVAERNPGHSVVFAGVYSNLKNSSYLQRVHNFIANSWLQQSYAQPKQNKLVLGGAFLAFAMHEIKIDHKIFWGAEDKFLSYQFSNMNFKINLLNEFSVLHNTSRSIKHFVRRAYLHGKNDIMYISEDKNKINYLFWIRKIGFANLNLLPLITCHFCIQRSAELIQKIRLLSSIKK